MASVDVRSRFPLSPHWLWQLRRRFFSVNPMSEVLWDINESRAGWVTLPRTVFALVTSLLWYGVILVLMVVLLQPRSLSVFQRMASGLVAVLSLMMALMWIKTLSLRVGSIHRRRMATRRDLLLQLTVSPRGASDWCLASLPMMISLFLPWITAFLLAGWGFWIAQRGVVWTDLVYLVLITLLCFHLLARMPVIGMEANLRGPREVSQARGLRLGLTVWIMVLIVPGILEMVRGDTLAQAIPFLGLTAVFVHASIEYHSRQARGRILTHLQAWAEAEWEKSQG